MEDSVDFLPAAVDDSGELTPYLVEGLQDFLLDFEHSIEIPPDDVEDSVDFQSVSVENSIKTPPEEVEDSIDFPSAAVEDK